jgi:hypothetical protein
MAIFSNVGAGMRQRKKLAAAVLGGARIALAAFLAGSWTGFSGALTLTSSPANVRAPGATMAPNMPPAMSGKMCCEHMKDMMNNMMKEMPGMSTMPTH